MVGVLEFRCPIYGFIPLDDWEYQIISQPAFQRLRRIRQLAWTDYVYPGAMHTRFEHSLGVMHMATLLFDGIISRNEALLRDELGYSAAGDQRYRRLIRLAALLHDVGHGPFSHAAEELAPNKGNRKFRHEEYSSAIINGPLRDVIENHRFNSNFGFRAEEVSGLIEGGAAAGRATIWQDLISGQLDADRMDYLLRDSYHSGVEYGKYDWRRIVATIQLVRDAETGSPRLGIHESGRHAAESLIIARYMMFNQVYFHKTRVILDYHLQEAMREILPAGVFPEPSQEGLVEYLKWDDWKVFGMLAEQSAGDHGRRLFGRDFHRVVWETPEFPASADIAQLSQVETALAGFDFVKREATKSWYKVGETDLQILERKGTIPLSECSTIVARLQPSQRTRIYVDRNRREEASKIIEELRRAA